MAFRRKPADETFELEVKITSPEGLEESFIAVVKRLSNKEIQQFQSDTEIVDAVLVKVKNVFGENGEAVTDEEAIQIVKDDMFAVPAIAAVFFRQRAKSAQIGKSR